MNRVESENNGKLDWVLEMLMAFITGCIVGAVTFNSCTKQNTPVENTAKIDSLITVNDSIKIKVEKLDSIKDAKIIEVSTLDNDSTLKLFYELVSE
jgi:hypothetical protein